MDQKLTTKQRKYLKQKHRKEVNKRVCDRIKAVLMYDDGYSYTEIANVLLLDDETIRRHVQDFYKRTKLAPKNGGSKSKLSKKEEQKLIIHLKEHTYLYVKDICAYVRSEFKCKYSISGMRKWLHIHGFRYKKPHAIPARADKYQQEEFKKRYEQLKEKAGEKEPIYFVDSVHPEYQTRLAYGWISRGERKEIQMTARQYRLNIMGGICLNGHKVIYKHSDKINGFSIQLYLYKLRKHHPGNYKVHVIWDNAGYHCSNDVKAIAKELGIELHYLPPYSPNLNPIERLWKIMHERVTYNRYYENFSIFTEAILNFFRHIGKNKTLLRSRISDNFQELGEPNFAS